MGAKSELEEDFTLEEHSTSSSLSAMPHSSVEKCGRQRGGCEVRAGDLGSRADK